MKRFFCCILLCLVFCSACTKKSEEVTEVSTLTSMDNGVVLDKFRQIALPEFLISDYEADSSKEDSLELYKCLLNSISSIELKDDCIIISVPSAEALADKVLNDVGVQNELSAMIAENTAAVDLEKYVIECCINALQLDVEKSQVIIQANLDANGEVMFKTGDVLNFAKSYLDYDYYVSNKSSEMGVDISDMEIVTVANNQSFISSVSGNNFIIKGIKIYTADYALEKLKSLSELNAGVTTPADEELVYVEYDVLNLSNKTIDVQNCFIAADLTTGTIYDNDGFKIIGLKDHAKVKKGKTKSMSCCIVKPENAKLIWYSDDYDGVCEIVY